MKVPSLPVVLLVAATLAARPTLAQGTCAEANFCSSTPNSTGGAAVISSNGECLVSENAFVLSAAPVPNQPGIFFYSSQQLNGGVGLPFGNGRRCVGNPVFRLPPTVATGNTLSAAVDFDAPPAATGVVLPGSMWFFQAWFRDPAAGGAFFDLSDGLAVTFEAEVLPTVELELASQTAAESDGQLVVRVTRSQATQLTTIVPYSVSGSALEGDDYTASAGVFTIAPGDATGEITILLAADGADEMDESIVITLGTPLYGTLGSQSVQTITLTDSDPPPIVEFANPNNPVPESAGTVGCTLTLSMPSAFDVTVPFTVGGTNPAGDYSTDASPVVIPAGSMSQDIDVTIVDDSLDEGNLTIVLSLGTPTNASLGNASQCAVVVLDNDAPPVVQFSLAQVSGPEGGGTLPVEVSLSELSGLNVFVDFTLSGTADPGRRLHVTRLAVRDPRRLLVAVDRPRADRRRRPRARRDDRAHHRRGYQRGARCPDHGDCDARRR